MTELQGHEDRVEIGADSGVFVRSREEGLHSRSRVGGSAPSLCQRARCYQSRPWDLLTFSSLPQRLQRSPMANLLHDPLGQEDRPSMQLSNPLLNKTINPLSGCMK